MRLVCPNCSAVYEVGPDVVPEAGREVKCSNCQHVWFQEYEAPGSHRRQDAPILSSNVPPRPALSEEVTSVLREEAEYESRAREEEAALEEQAEAEPEENKSGFARGISSDFVVEHEFDDPAEDATADMVEVEIDDADEAAPFEETFEETEISDEVDVADHAEYAAESEVEAETVTATEEDVHNQDALPRELLPDIEEINSTLNSSHAPRTRSGGFRTGFLLSLMLIGGGVAVYSYAPEIVDAWPEGRDVISSYVEQVDVWRYKLYSAVGPIF